jgi:isoleucine--tRNA ligase
LASAPDWNVARNRYRGSPLPIWENVADPEDRMSIANLDELFHLTKTGSKNLTKNIFIRHGRTNFNDEKKVDALGDSVLTDLGQEQSQNLVAKLEHLKAEKSELIFVLSPLQRTRQTIKPTLLSRFSESEVTAREKQYYAISEQYRAAFADRSLQERLQGADDKVVFQLGEQIFVDWRLTDHLSFADQATVRPCDLLNRKDPSKPIGVDGETITQNSSRVKNALKYWNNKAKSQTLIFVSHADTIGLARQAFRNFDYAKQRKIFLPKNAEIKVHYWDNDRNAEVDLHKPYVDNYRGIQNGKTYKRTSEVLDCWFESGSMPFGQDHYL